MTIETLRVFADRTEAGLRLARKLARYRRHPDTLVVGLPRGGVVTAAAVAEELELPLDALIVRKLGVPHIPELAMGAVAAGGVRVLNDDVIRSLHIQREDIDEVVDRETREVARREAVYRRDRSPIAFAGKTVIIVDDGIATGSTIAAAAAVIRRQGAAHIVIAVPVAAPESCGKLRRSVDDFVCLEMPQAFYAVGQWYADFSEVEDEEVVRILQHARNRVPA